MLRFLWSSDRLIVWSASGCRVSCRPIRTVTVGLKEPSTSTNTDSLSLISEADALMRPCLSQAASFCEQLRPPSHSLRRRGNGIKSNAFYLHLFLVGADWWKETKDWALTPTMEVWMWTLLIKHRWAKEWMWQLVHKPQATKTLPNCVFLDNFSCFSRCFLSQKLIYVGNSVTSPAAYYSLEY